MFFMYILINCFQFWAFEDQDSETHINDAFIDIMDSLNLQVV